MIIIKEAINFMPCPLLNQLKSDDQLISPIGPLDRGQMLKLVEKSATGDAEEVPLIPVRFSPLHGGERIYDLALLSKYRIAASTPPFWCGTPETPSPISTPARVPINMSSLKSPR